MGKSAAAEFLRQRPVPVVDTDLIARQVTEPGQPALAELQSAFGEEIVDEDGHLHRGKLARIVFADLRERQKLEAILHPRIRLIWVAEVESLRRADKALAIVVIPLLFETDSASLFDATICVACSIASQRQRLLARGWTPEHIEQRIKAQWSIEKKMFLADFVIWTEGSPAVHAEQLERIIPPNK